MIFLASLLFGLTAGLRHGFDLDHLAAIADITSSQRKTFKALKLSFLYAIGHGLMVIILGLALITLGQALPENIDQIFGKIVGVTLIFLGIYVLFSIAKDRENFKLKSKWMLVFRKTPPPFGLGLIHGIGAETPTQIGAFLVLLDLGGGIQAVFFLLSFVLGIFISNMAIALMSIFGYKNARKNKTIYLMFGFLTAIFSLVLGISLLL